MIQAIPTKFDGWSFRSRTEARWAVLFKTAGIAYEYEKEGFSLNGRWYLPDFWFPELEGWFEVKGVEPTAPELELCKQLANGTGRMVFIGSGTPEPYRNPLAIAPRGMHPADIWAFDAPASAYLAAREAQFERGPTAAETERAVLKLYGPPRR